MGGACTGEALSGRKELLMEELLLKELLREDLPPQEELSKGGAF